MAQALAREETSDWKLGGLLGIAFGHGVNDFFSGTVALTIFFVATQAGVSAWYQGALGFLWYLTSSLVQPFFGAFCDRHGRWWFMPAGVLLVVVAISFASLASSLWVLALLVMLGGLGSAIMHPEAGKYAALLSGTRKSGGISVFQIGGSVGFALGPVTIAALLAHLGRNASFALLLPGVIAAACVFVAVRRADQLARPQRIAPAARASGGASVDTFAIGLVVAGTAIRFLTTTAFVTYLPNLLTARGASLENAGTVVTAFLLVSIAGMYLGGTLGDRFGPVPASVLALLGAVPALAGFLVAPQPLALGFLLLGGVLLAVQNAPGVVIVQSLLPRNLGMALGLINGVAFGAGSALVTVVGVLVTRFGAPNALLGASLMPVLAAVAYLIVARRLSPGTLAPAR
jgi:FSR family fosmidomycin resistance protein-like MFS transporter